MSLFLHMLLCSPSELRVFCNLAKLLWLQPRSWRVPIRLLRKSFLTPEFKIGNWNLTIAINNKILPVNTVVLKKNPLTTFWLGKPWYQSLPSKESVVGRFLIQAKQPLCCRNHLPNPSSGETFIFTHLGQVNIQKLQKRTWNKNIAENLFQVPSTAFVAKKQILPSLGLCLC